MTSAPLAIKVDTTAPPAAPGVRDWMAGLDAATGKPLWRKFTIRRPATRQRNLEGQEQRLADRRRRNMGDRTHDPTPTRPSGTGNPVPMYDPTYRPGDNLHQQRDLLIPTPA
jgi:alcohol dehydrogenase (cytochrome c)